MKQNLVLAKNIEKALSELESIQLQLTRIVIKNKFGDLHRNLMDNNSRHTAAAIKTAMVQSDVFLRLLSEALKEAHIILLQRAKYDNQQATSGGVSSTNIRRKSSKGSRRK